MARYNTNVIELLPEAPRPAILTAYHRHGIYPYAERDWRELAIVRERAFEPGAVGQDDGVYDQVMIMTSKN